MSEADDGDLQEPTFPAAELAGVLGGQYLIGGVLVMLWVRGPVGGPTHGRGAVTALAVLSVAIGLIMLALWRAPLSPSTKRAANHVCILSAQCIIAAGYAATREPFNELLLFLLWTTPYAGVFSRRARLVHAVGTGTVITAAVVWIVQAGVPLYSAAVSGAMTLATVTIVTLLVARVSDALGRQALTDALTGLPNRRAFAAATREALEHGTDLAVVLIDLDRFKNVNDTYGHHAGDALLLALAPRLASHARADDVVARLGGDEFGVLLRGVDAESAHSAAARYAVAWSVPVVLEHGPVAVSGSTGYALATPSSTPHTLLREADAAMYLAKEAGDGTPQPFEPSLQRASARRLQLESDLRQALARGGIEVHYQPVLAGRGPRTVVGVEALARWTHPTLGDVPPDEFVPLAESVGCIEALGELVARRAVADLASWRDRGLVSPTFGVAVNVSPLQLGDRLPTLLGALLHEYQVPASCLGVEVTESAVVRGLPAEESLAALHTLGVVLLLDDFGTGESSLSRLHRFPFDVIKIDRGFVAALHGTPGDRRLVQAILSMATAMGLEVLAEGVETDQQETVLHQLGCETTQGWLYAAAVPAQELPALVLRLEGDPVGAGA